MSELRTLPQAFVGGELGPRMFGRPADPKYQEGAARLRNFYTDPTGSASNRPGTEFVHSTRNPDARARAINYDRGGNRSIQLEFGIRQEWLALTSIVPGYVRFHADGGTLLHSTPWNAATPYVVGDQVTQGGQLYRCRLANTNQTPPSSAYWETLEYVANRAFNAAAAAPPNSGIVVGSPGEIYFGNAVNHNLEANEPVEFTGDLGTTAPAGIVYGVVYYAIIIDPERIRIAATPGGAALPITTVGVGTTHRMHRRYFDGEFVSQSGAVFYCRLTRPIDGSGLSIPANAGNETYWYQEPSTGELEIPTTLALTEDQLFAMTYSQQGNVLSLATGIVAGAELRRVTAYSWTWALTSFAPSIAAPTGVVATATKRGSSLAIVSIAGAGPISVNTTTEHRLIAGLDFVYIECPAQANLHQKFCGVENGANASNFKPVDPETGAYFAGPSVGSTSGTVRVTRLNSDESNSYVVTAISAEGRESQQSDVATVVNNLFVNGAYNTITWAPVVGAVRYRIYKLLRSSGLYGVIGQSTLPSFADGPPSFAAQLDQTPPILDTSLGVGAGNFPRAVTHHESRRAFGGPDNDTQGVWLTRTNTESDLSYSIPVKATDRIQQRVKSRRACTILHLVSVGKSLVALCDTTEIRIGPVDGEALTPESFASLAQTFIGAAPVQPDVMQNAILFAAACGGHLYQMGWSEDSGGYVALDMCERAAHLFDGLSIVQIAVQMTPVPIAWCVMSNGRLLGVTFVRAQQVLAWHWHDTDGFIESIAVGVSGGGAGGPEHRATLFVRRTINGVTKRYVERMRSMLPTAWADSWLVDCGLRYSGAPVTTITGLAHLEGKLVSVFADGLVQTQKTVAGGQIDLDVAASQVLVGLPITGQLWTLPAMFAVVEAYGTGRPKSVNKVFPRVEASGPFLIGSAADNLLPTSNLADGTPIAAGAPFGGILEVGVEGNWTYDGQLFFEVRDPVPVTVVSVTAEMAVGG